MGLSDEGILVVAELEGLMANVAMDEAWSYDWLPTRVVCSAACLACACALRPGGKLKEAMQYVERGQGLVREELAAQHVDMEVGAHVVVLLPSVQSKDSSYDNQK